MPITARKKQQGPEALKRDVKQTTSGADAEASGHQTCEASVTALCTGERDMQQTGKMSDSQWSPYR